MSFKQIIKGVIIYKIYFYRIVIKFIIIKRFLDKTIDYKCAVDETIVQIGRRTEGLSQIIKRECE